MVSAGGIWGPAGQEESDAETVQLAHICENQHHV